MPESLQELVLGLLQVAQVLVGLRFVHFVVVALVMGQTAAVHGPVLKPLKHGIC